MVMCKEEIFNWFKELSGAKRIELMCGLLNLCIPLEWRFFATFLEQATKRDHNSLKEAEIKSNSPQEFEKLTNSDWLAVENYAPIEEDNDSNNGLRDTNTANHSVNASSANCHTNDNSNSIEHLSSVRSKIVVYLCLLTAANRICANLAFKAFIRQLCLDNIANHFFGSLNDPTIESNSNTSSPLISNPNISNKSACKDSNVYGGRVSTEHGPSHLILDSNFYSEIVLLHTLAIHHPAFTFEQQTLLNIQLKQVQRWMDAVLFATAATASATTNSGSSCVSPLTTVPNVGIGDGSQLVSMTNKLSLKSNQLNDQSSISFTEMHPKNVAEAGRKFSPPVSVVASSCVKCHRNCTCSPSNLSSVVTTPSTTPPPPVPVPGQNHLGNIQMNHHHIPPHCFYLLPTSMPPLGPMLNGYNPPTQTTDQLFHYCYMMAMAARLAGNTFGTTYWAPFQASSSIPPIPTPSLEIDSLVAAAASFESSKSPSSFSCYNCGEHGHHGGECKQESFDEQQQIRY